jgi:hypothetical protein
MTGKLRPLTGEVVITKAGSKFYQETKTFSSKLGWSTILEEITLEELKEANKAGVSIVFAYDFFFSVRFNFIVPDNPVAPIEHYYYNQPPEPGWYPIESCDSKPILELFYDYLRLLP